MASWCGNQSHSQTLPFPIMPLVERKLPQTFAFPASRSLWQEMKSIDLKRLTVSFEFCVETPERMPF
jgi:hypothetical protein